MTIFVQHSLRGKQLFLFVSIRLSCQDVFPNSDYPSACSRCVPPAGSGIWAPAKVIVEPQYTTLRPPLSPVLAWTITKQPNHQTMNIFNKLFYILQGLTGAAAKVTVVSQSPPFALAHHQAGTYTVCHTANILKSF